MSLFKLDDFRNVGQFKFLRLTLANRLIVKLNTAYKSIRNTSKFMIYHDFNQLLFTYKS